jgi:hypothetical protein
MKKSSQDSQSPAQDLNLEPPEYGTIHSAMTENIQ